MRSHIGVGLALLATVVVSGCSSSGDPPVVASRQDNTASKSGAMEGPVARGKNVYQQNCVMCHGPGGKGDGPNAYQCSKPPSNLCDADLAERSKTALFRKISTGGSGMPAFGRLLSEKDRSDVVEYVRSLSTSPRQQEADSHF